MLLGVQGGQARDGSGQSLWKESRARLRASLVGVVSALLDDEAWLGLPCWHAQSPSQMFFSQALAPSLRGPGSPGRPVFVQPSTRELFIRCEGSPVSDCSIYITWLSSSSPRPPAVATKADRPAKNLLGDSQLAQLLRWTAQPPVLAAVPPKAVAGKVSRRDGSAQACMEMGAPSVQRRRLLLAAGALTYMHLLPRGVRFRPPRLGSSRS